MVLLGLVGSCLGDDDGGIGQVAVVALRQTTPLSSSSVQMAWLCSR